jgi:RNA polymerase sigma-70 factor, ECF subfamily
MDDRAEHPTHFPTPEDSALRGAPVSEAGAALHRHDDQAVVEAMAAGDERAAGVLYDRHAPVMYGLALRLVTEPADAEEVVLEAFAQAWRDASRYMPGRGSVQGWLTMIVRSRALDVVRARIRRARTVDSAAAEGHDAPVAMSAGSPAPDQSVEDTERSTALGAALRTLPEPQRHAIELAFFEGLTHQEVAERLREPLGTIKTRIRLGMLKLREMLYVLAPEQSI